MESLKKFLNLTALVCLASSILIVKSVTSFAAGLGDVVINEVAWAGTSDDSNDEWIELYNPTSLEIDLSGWFIEDDTTTKYEIVSGKIAPHGYFLIEDNEDSVKNLTANAVIGLSLANAGDSLVLKDTAGLVVDSVNASGGAWYSGNATSKATMERIDPLVKVDSATNFGTAVAGNGAVGINGGSILGTPAGANSVYAGHGPEVSIASATASIGENVTVSIDAKDIVDLYGYGFEINYDPSVLSYISATESSFLKADLKETSFSVALQNGVEGTVIVGDARLVNPPSGVDGSGKLLDIVFNVKNTTSTTTALSFGASSFLADTIGDMVTKFTGTTITIGSSSALNITNLKISAGQERYSFGLTWDQIAGSTYVVKRENVNGTYEIIKEGSDNFYVDNTKIVVGVEYSYQVFAVKNGITGGASSISGTETRGLKGDSDRSDRIDGKDIEKLARSFGSEYADEEYDALKDFNYDGIIDGADLIVIGANFGLKY
ncbi:lamin tail domain-containing protein [Candidatus Gracilibacteria bacterium]|nr:lamin tail domain-containing protein [Candidatus Gracilibacteria bacterium]